MIDNFDVTKTSVTDSFHFISFSVSLIKQYCATVISIISYGFVVYSIFYVREQEGKLQFSIPKSRKQIWKRLFQNYGVTSPSQMQKNFQKQWLQILMVISVLVMLLSFVGFVVTILNSLYIFTLVNFIFYTLPILVYIIIFILCLRGFNKLKSFLHQINVLQERAKVISKGIERMENNIL